MGSQENLLRSLGYPGPDAVAANRRAFDYAELSTRLEALKDADFAAFKVGHGIGLHDTTLVVSTELILEI